MAEDAERIEEHIEEHWYTVNEVARRLKVHPNTIRRAIRAGRLTAAQLSAGGAIRISSIDLAAYLAQARNSEPALSAEK